MKYSSHSTQPMPGAHGRTRKVPGSGTTTILGEPVISGSSMPPPRMKEENMRAPEASSVELATVVVWPLVRAARKPGSVTAFAREAP